MPTHQNPRHVVPTPGNVLVQVVDRLGGLTPGGLFVPESADDTHNRDTAYGRVLKVGPPAYRRLAPHKKALDRACDWVAGPRWPERYEPLQEGDVVLFPRDVPIAIVHDTGRYAVVHRTELICVLEGDTTDFRVVPWDDGGLHP